MIKAKKSDKDMIIWFEWDGDLSFAIRYIRRSVINKLRINSVKKIGGRMGKRVDESDPIYFSELFVKEAVVDWKGLTYKNMQEICEPLDILEKDLNKEIEFNDENLEFVAKNINVDFSNFVIEGSNLIGEEKENALKNLEITSDGKETV